jgi:hypothetical protein
MKAEHRGVIATTKSNSSSPPNRRQHFIETIDQKIGVVGREAHWRFDAEHVAE